MLLHSNRERRMSFLDPTIGAFNMSLPARQRHLCLAGTTVHRSRTTSVALLVHYSHTRHLNIRLGLVALVSPANISSRTHDRRSSCKIPRTTAYAPIATLWLVGLEQLPSH